MKIPILIVEDDNANVEAAKTYFATREEFKPTFAGTKENALELLTKNSYAAAICDVNIPEYEGGDIGAYGPVVSGALEFTKTPFVYLTTLDVGNCLVNFTYKSEAERQKNKTFRHSRPEDTSSGVVTKGEEAWETALETLLSTVDMDLLTMIAKSKSRYQRTFGRPFIGGK
jgi:hypothetical protein